MMTMAIQLTKVLTPEMEQAIRTANYHGGKIFLAVPEDNERGCTNCNGGGALALQTVVGGPFDSPQPGRGQGNTRHCESPSPINIYEGGKWYQAKVKSYKCPVCKGAPGLGKR